MYDSPCSLYYEHITHLVPLSPPCVVPNFIGDY